MRTLRTVVVAVVLWLTFVGSLTFLVALGLYHLSATVARSADRPELRLVVDPEPCVRPDGPSYDRVLMSRRASGPIAAYLLAGEEKVDRARRSLRRPTGDVSVVDSRGCELVRGFVPLAVWNLALRYSGIEVEPPPPITSERPAELDRSPWTE